MKQTSLLCLVAGVLTLAGCSSTPTRVDKGPIPARSFSFIDPGARSAPGFADSRQPVHAAIQEAITRNLAAKGLTRAVSGGDIIVAYLIVVGNNASTAAVDDYFGYGRDAASLQEKAQAAYSGSKNPNYFEAGTLVVDVIDAKSYKLLWRGHASRQLLRSLPADVRAARLQEVVNEILQEVRFSPK